MLYYLDIFGTLVFAVAGTFKAIKHELDILGVCTLALITGVGGGIFRDLLLGDTPPAAFRDETYFIICIGRRTAGGPAFAAYSPHLEGCKDLRCTGLRCIHRNRGGEGRGLRARVRRDPDDRHA